MEQITIIELAQKLGVSADIVWGVVRRLHISLYSQKEIHDNGKVRAVLVGEQIEKITQAIKGRRHYRLRKLNNEKMASNLKEHFSSESLIGTKELAEMLGVATQSIRRVLKKTDNLNGSVEVGKGKHTFFTEAQATAIKQEIQSHHNLPSRQIDNVTTPLEENAVILKAIKILQERLTAAEQRAQIAESAVAQITDIIKSTGVLETKKTAEPMGLIKKAQEAQTKLEAERKEAIQQAMEDLAMATDHPRDLRTLTDEEREAWVKAKAQNIRMWLLCKQKARMYA